MSAPDLETCAAGMKRLAGVEILGAGYVPDYSVFMLFCSNEVTLYCSVKDGQLQIEVDAPVLQ